MAEWKKIITSGSTAELGGISSSLAIVPTTDNGADIGSAGLEWKDLYIDGVAYLDEARIGQLGAALDANSQAITNVDIDSGNIDNTAIGATTPSTIAGTTIDASTDFTIGGTVITDSKITDDGTFTIDAATDIELNADGGDIFIKDGTAPVATININTISGSSVSTGSFGQLELAGGTFTSASLAAAIANDGDITRVNITAGNGLGGTQDTTDGEHTQTLSVNAAQTTITSVKNDSLVIGRTTANDLITFSSGDISLGIGGTEVLGVDSTGVVVTGNLTVNGTTTTVNTANTNVKDRFLLLNSGSATGDGGIIVQGNVNQSGSAFAYDSSADRWGFQSGSVGANAVGVVPESYTAEVVTSDVASRRKNGNIKVESEEIWIYVE